MLGGLVQAGTKALGGERFSLVNVLPATLLVGYVAFLAASGLYAGHDFSMNDLPRTLGRNAGWAVLTVFGVFVASVLVRPFQIALVWTLEGYWDRVVILKSIAPLAIEHHHRRRHTAEVIESREVEEQAPAKTLERVVAEQRRLRHAMVLTTRAARIRGRYPKDRPVFDDDGGLEGCESRIMPTRLGNILRKAEDDAGGRYGLALPHIAPRLYPHLSDKIAKEIVRNLDLIEGGAALSTVYALAAVVSLPLLGRSDPWLSAPLVAAALGFVAYLGTVRTAQEHGRLLATAVDLYRFDMIAKLHYKLPTTAEEEWDFNVALSDFFAHGDQEARDVMADYSYVHAEKAEWGQAVAPAPPGDVSVQPAGEEAAG
jgi:hypothetical protein